MTNFVEYQGKTILKIDFEGVLSMSGAEDLAKKAYKLVKMNRSSELLVLYNFGNFQFTKEFVKMSLPFFTQENMKKVIRRAFVTVDDSQKEFLRMACNKMFSPLTTECFLSEAKAMNFLVQEKIDINDLVLK